VSDAVRHLAQELGSLPGLNINAFGLEDRFSNSDRPLWNGVSLRLAKVMGPRSFGYAPQLGELLRAAKIELLHVHGLWMYPSIACCLWSRGHRPYIVSPHGMLDPWALRNSAWKKKIAGWLYENRHLRGARCFHALCEAEAAAIREYGLRNPVAVIPNGVDLPAEREGFSAPWAKILPEGVRVLLFLGRLHPKKNAASLIRAWGATQGATQDGWCLVIAGWDQGGHKGELLALAQELGLEQRIWFSGPLFGEEKDAALRSASAFVLPSLSEGLPMAVLEAWAYGLPVLMTPECNLTEGFGAGAAIRIGHDPEAIARGLEQLFAMKDTERAEMGARGRKLVEEKFSWPKIARQMKEVYEWVLGKGPKPECVVTD